MMKRLFLIGVIGALSIVNTPMVANAATISGIVSDSAGSPLDNITVSLIASAGAVVTVIATETTDAAGVYSITCDPTSETYIVRAIDPAGVYFMQSDSITMDGTDKTVDIMMPLIKHAAVSGIVTDSVSGTPIAGVRVTVGFGRTRATDTTDAAGKYSFDSVSTGTPISFSATGYVTKTVTPDIGDAAVTLDVPLVVMKYSQVSGTVTDSAAGTPIKGVIVWRGGRSADTTDADGKYSLDSVSTGTAISFSSTEYITKTVNPAIGDEALTLDITLIEKKNCAVSGTVTDSASGTPINGAIVWVGISPKDTTGEDGKYSVSTIATGDYLSVSATGYFVKITTPAVGDDALVADFFLIRIEYGSLTGTVTDSATGAAMAGVVVRCGSGRDTTGEDGTYALDSVFSGRGTIIVSATGYTSKSSSVTIIADSTIVVDFSLSDASMAVKAADRIVPSSMLTVAADRLIFRNAGDAGVAMLMNVKGELVAVQSFPANTTTYLELGRLSAGTYILKVKWRNGSLLRRILVR